MVSEIELKLLRARVAGERLKHFDKEDALRVLDHLIACAPCPEGILPDGPVCPRCGKARGPSGVGGGTWVHAPAKDDK